MHVPALGVDPLSGRTWSRIPIVCVRRRLEVMTRATCTDRSIERNVLAFQRDLQGKAARHCISMCCSFHGYDTRTHLIQSLAFWLVGLDANIGLSVSLAHGRLR